MNSLTTKLGEILQIKIELKITQVPESYSTAVVF